jgi:D-proline reductase (dithiol) PrdB
VHVKPLRNRDDWEAGFRSGWLAHWQATEEVDWKRYPRLRNKEAPAGKSVNLSTSRLMLITSSGAYLPGEQEPFDAENVLGDYTIRVIPTSTPLEQLAYAHTHYDHAARKEDPQVLIPTGHLDEMVAQGRIGEMAPSMVSFMGYQPDVTRVVDETAAEALRVAKEEAVNAALLVPA